MHGYFRNNISIFQQLLNCKKRLGFLQLLYEVPFLFLVRQFFVI
ncbi:hypothetical protein HMPREF0022_02433 [Acinetobacter baumannii 6014059]|uniref:Uncharacterized protein n=1 Tax=Acinetobacter baumannii 6014059 TaxID=525242 RepID=A0A828SR08_ACIBA|nr:hypothetical protein HMPREF0022_02433 [Acinetobacter baumannii 6014059]